MASAARDAAEAAEQLFTHGEVESRDSVVGRESRSYSCNDPKRGDFS